MIENKINFTVGVNTWYKKLMANENFHKIKVANIHTSLAGGEFVPQSTKDTWLKLSHKPLYSAYGLTETSSLAIISPLDKSDIPNSIGIAIPDTKIVLLNDEDVEIIEENIPGEIALKGPQITTGYFNNPEETRKAFFNGWFKTGDVGVRKNTNIYQLIDRKKDMISISGNKVFPNEIEEVVLHLDGITDVAAFGVKSSETGEAIILTITTNRTILDSEIINHCQQFLSRYKIPKRIYRFEELPKTAIGKTDRNKLRELIKQIN